VSCIVTLAVDAASQARFDRERLRWFPPERNQIAAHLTLFHTLPESSDTETPIDAAASARAAFPMRVAELRSLGRGVAYFLQSQALAGLHSELAHAFAEHLTPQDRQGFRPHVVVQNKASAPEVSEALTTLRAAFQPFTVTAVGIDLWRYLGGPWQFLRRFEFRDSADAG
jgi:2'-5' RNA ligase